MDTRQQSINAKCKDCIHDPGEPGTWVQQVEACELTECALWGYRPLSRAKVDADPRRVSVQALNEPIRA